MENIHDKPHTALKSKTQSYRLIFHYFICSLGLLSGGYIIGVLIGRRLAHHFGASIHYYGWTKASMEFAKPGELVGYILPTMLLFLYYGIIALYQKYGRVLKNASFLSNLKSPYYILMYFLVLLLTNACPFLFVDKASEVSFIYVLLFVISWLIITIAPLRCLAPNNGLSGVVDKPQCMGNDEHIRKLVPQWSFLSLTQVRLKKISDFLQLVEHSLSSRYFSCMILLLMCALIAQVWWTFLPYIARIPYLHNDYMGITEETKLGTAYVDNITYFRSHRLNRLLGFDPLIFQNKGVLVSGRDFVALKKTPAIVKFVNENQKYTYDESYPGLFVKNTMTKDESDALCEIVSSSLDCKRITDFYEFNNSDSQRQYSSEESEFIGKNMYEYGSQVAIGHYFLHHSFFLLPINAYKLGKPQLETTFQYGWLNSVFLATLFEYGVKLDFANYLRVTYVFYPIYFTLIVLSAFLIFDGLWYALFVSLLCVGGLYLMGFESIYMAPGFNPIRHFFDVFVFVFFYNYLFNSRRNSFYLFLTILLAVISYLCDKEFGLFVVGGLAFALIVKFVLVSKIKKSEIGIILLGLLALVLSVSLVKTGKNPAYIYYLLGYLVPFTDANTILNFMIFFSIIYCFLLFHVWKDDRWKIFCCYFFGYSQLSLLYYIWNPSANHFFSIVFSWAFLITILLKELLNMGVLRRYHRILVMLACAFFVYEYYVPAFSSYLQGKEIQAKVYKDHKVYFWEMPNAQFYSTMNPAPFAEAVTRINKYSKGNGIYIISRFDNLLPFLSNKYSLMPFDQTILHLITDKELQSSADAILANKPDYIFVDSLLLNLNLGVVAEKIIPEATAYDFIYNRYLAFHGNLHRLFELIEGHYVLVERGQLIDVYKRRS